MPLKQVKQMKIKSDSRASDLIEAMRSSGVLGAGRVARAADLLSSMFSNPNYTVIQSLAGPAVAGGLRNIISDLIARKLVNAVVSNGSNVTHDILEALGFSHLCGQMHTDDVSLRRKGIGRVGDVYVGEDAFRCLENEIYRMLNRITDKNPERILGVYELLGEIGGMLKGKKSILKAASAADIPIFCPGVYDSMLGFHLWSYSRLKKLLGPVVEWVQCLDDVLNIDKLLTPAAWRPVQVDPESPAFLQFTSGTTVEPKAVMVSHVSLLCNLDMIDSFFQRFNEEQAAQGGVCWLPLYHDMGLVGCMYIGLYHPGTVTYIGPEVFIGKPKIWLQTLSRYKAVISPAPDFAYGLCLSKVKDQDLEGVDLSHWRIALNGAEPIDVRGMQGFCERFARWGFRIEAMTPVYGLAEAGLAVTFSDPAILVLSNFTFPRPNATHFALTNDPLPTSPSYLNLSHVTIRIDNETFVVSNSNAPGVVLEKGANVTIFAEDGRFDWSSWSGREMIVEVHTTQGFVARIQETIP